MTYFDNLCILGQLDDIALQRESLSAAQLLYRARRIGNCLRSSGGCQPGDTVLLFSELRPDAVCVLLAGLLTGIRVAVLEHTADLRKHSGGVGLAPHLFTVTNATQYRR